MPFKFLRYLIYFSNYEGTSDMVSLYVRTTYVQISRKTRYVFHYQRIVSPIKQDAWTDAVWNFKISHLVLEIWGKIGNGQSIRKYVRPISRKTRYVFQNQRIVSPRKQDACTDAVRIFKIYHLVLEIWGKIENGQSTRKYVFSISR